MTASERRWKWVKKEALPVDLTKLMDQLKGGKKKDKTTDAQASGDEEDIQKEKVEKAEFLTQIKRDFLTIDYT